MTSSTIRSIVTATVTAALLSGTALTTAAAGPARPRFTLDLAVQAGCPFCIAIQRGAEAEAKALGVDLTTVSPATADTASQIQQLSGVLADHPDLLILQPFDEAALVPAVHDFAAAKIPTITVDADIADTAARLTLISSDNELGGKMGAEALAKLIGGKGKVVYFGYPPGMGGTDLRQKGFEQAIKAESAITYLGAQYSADDETKVAAQVTALLQSDPDIAGIFAGAESHTTGVAAAIREAGRAGKIAVIGFDGAPDEVVALKGGAVSMLIVQKAFEMGRRAIRDGVAYVGHGTRPPATTYTDYALATPQNMGDPAVADFLYPEK